MKVFIGALVVLLATTGAGADPGLDVVLIVDRSTSMAPHAQLTAPMLRLSADLLARNARAYGVEHRMAIVGFGSSASVEMPFTRVGSDDVASQIARLQSRFQGDTDVLSAFVAAGGLFRSIPVDPARRRSIVVLTDGVPYVRAADMRRYDAVLRQYVATQLAASGITLDILLIARERGAQRDAFWRSVSGRVHPVDRAPADVLATAHAVLTQLAGTASAESAPSKTIAGADSIVVPPYLEVIVFDVFRSAAGTSVEIVPPHGARGIHKGAAGVEEARMGDVLTTLVVARPEPGHWLIRKSRGDSRVRVRSQQFFPRGVLLLPDDDEVIASDRVRIAYRVLDGADRPIRELPGYPLSLRLTLTGPGGSKAAVPMTRDSDFAPATFHSADGANCTKPGRYWTDAHVMTMDAERRPLEVFRDRWSGFTVTAPATAPLNATAATALPKIAPSRLPVWLLAAAGGVLIAVRAMLRRRKT
ncbi:MAG TPA: vWA domain-containing protein [Thermoanaerobaculia bacterium]